MRLRLRPLGHTLCSFTWDSGPALIILEESEDAPEGITGAVRYIPSGIWMPQTRPAKNPGTKTETIETRWGSTDRPRTRQTAPPQNVLRWDVAWTRHLRAGRVRRNPALELQPQGQIRDTVECVDGANKYRRGRFDHR